MKNKKVNMSKLSPYLRMQIIDEHPEFINKCNLSIMEQWFVLKILMKNPEYITEKNVAYLESYNLVKLLKKHTTKVAKFCPWDKIRIYEWVDLLQHKKYIRFISHCNLSEMGYRNLVKLLCAQPQLADKCDMTKMSSCDWDELLKKRPELAVYRKTK